MQALERNSRGNFYKCRNFAPHVEVVVCTLEGPFEISPLNALNWFFLHHKKRFYDWRGDKKKVYLTPFHTIFLITKSRFVSLKMHNFLSSSPHQHISHFHNFLYLLHNRLRFQRRKETALKGSEKNAEVSHWIWAVNGELMQEIHRWVIKINCEVAEKHEKLLKCEQFAQ